MAQRGLAARMLLAGAVVTVLAVLAGIAVWATQRDVLEARAQRDGLVRAAQTESRLLTAYVDEQTGLRGYLLSGDPVFLAPYDRSAAAVPELTEQLRSIWADLEAPPALVDDLDTAHSAWAEHAADQIDRAVSDGVESASTVALVERGRALFDSIRSAERDLDVWIVAEQSRVAGRLGDLQARLATLVVATLVALVLVAGAGCLVLWRAVGRPLDRLAAATRAVADGDLDAPLPARGAPEVRTLAAGVGAMRDRLAADLHGTQQALDALDQRGPVVSALRAALEPTGDGVDGICVAGRLDPAEGVLAGDWFDTITLPDGRLGVVVGDVAGHGPESAVFALRLKHGLRTAIRTGLTPGDALGAVCAQLADDPPGRFATVFVAVADPTAGTVDHANAGHPSGLVFRGGSLRSELGTTGPLLSSVVLGRSWRTERSTWGSGDVLVVHTDGVTEARDATGAEFGVDGIVASVGSTGSDDARRMVDGVAAASMRFGGSARRSDDHTVVCLQRTAG